jgi:hypothetical protein
MQAFDLPRQGIDFLRGEFSSEFRHVALAISNDVAQFVRRRAANFATHERWSPKVTALSGFAMAPRAIRNIDRICGQGRVGRVVLAKSCRDRKAKEIHNDCELDGFQIGLLRKK